MTAQSVVAPIAHSLLGVVQVVIVVAYCICPTQRAAAACANSTPRIFVGGTVGIDSLSQPSRFTELAASCKVGLYIHDYSWIKASVPEREAILRAFAPSPSQVVELGASADADRYWTTRFQKQYLDLGVVAAQAHVNNGQELTAEQWSRYVYLANAGGIRTVSIVYSPNSGQWRGSSFDSDQFKALRAKMMIGGGVTVDSPPHFFINAPEGYKTFVEHEILWAQRSHLLATWIISPADSGADFLNDTRRLLEWLAQDQVNPDQLIIENYEPLPASASYTNPIGDEKQPNSILAVALWIVKNYHLGR